MAIPFFFPVLYSQAGFHTSASPVNRGNHDGSSRVLKLSFQQLHALVGALHSVDEESREQSDALLARFKYFQRMRFPDRRPGRGSQAGYELEDVLRLVLAFELVAVGAGPSRAALLVQSNWRWLQGLLALCWRSVAIEGAGEEPQVLALAAHLLLEPEQGSGSPVGLSGDRSPSPTRQEGDKVFFSIDRRRLADWLLHPEDGSARAYAIVDPLRLVEAFRLLVLQLGFEAETVDGAFEGLGRRAFGTDAVKW
jgi:hypothetical protein